MLDYVKAFIIKYVMTTAILWITLSVLYGVGFGRLLLLSLFLTVVGFFLGDLFLLPLLENWGTAIVDFLLAFAGVWVFSTYFVATSIPVYTAATLSAVIFAVCELFFHKYMDSHILHSNSSTGRRKRDELKPEERMQTEFGEEIDTDDEKE